MGGPDSPLLGERSQFHCVLRSPRCSTERTSIGCWGGEYSPVEGGWILSHAPMRRDGLVSNISFEAKPPHLVSFTFLSDPALLPSASLRHA